MATQVETSDLLYEKTGHIARIIFNRPEKLNAITPEMFKKMMESLDDARQDDDIKVVIFKGNGPCFSAGHDLTRAGFISGYGYGGTAASGQETADRPPSQRARLKRDFEEVIHRVRYVMVFPKVTIAQVHGHCIGGPKHLAECCDVTIVAEDAKISWEEARHGHAAGSDLWSALHLGPKKARLLGLIGGVLSGQQATDLGWASMCVPLDRLESETERIAMMVAKQPRDGIAIGKARRRIDLESMGVCHYGVDAVLHTLFSNVRFEDDETNFYKDRHDLGVREAMHKLTRVFEES